MLSSWKKYTKTRLFSEKFKDLLKIRFHLWYSRQVQPNHIHFTWLICTIPANNEETSINQRSYLFYWAVSLCVFVFNRKRLCSDGLNSSFIISPKYKFYRFIMMFLDSYQKKKNAFVTNLPVYAQQHSFKWIWTIISALKTSSLWIWLHECE